jgi:uncharacterized protein
VTATSPAHVVRSVYAAFGRGDLDAVLASVSDDCDWRCLTPREVPFSGSFRGPGGVRDFFTRVLGAVRLESFAPRTFLADGDTVVVLGADRATVVATGKAYAADWVHVWTVRDGRATSFREFLDGAVADAFAR